MTPGSALSCRVASAEVSIRSRLVESIGKGWDWRDRFEGDEDEGGFDSDGRVRQGADAARRMAGDGFWVGVQSASGNGVVLGESVGGFGVTRTTLDEAALCALVEGRVGVLVNSAGLGLSGKRGEVSDADWGRRIEMYLMNVVRAMRVVAALMVGGRSSTSCPSRRWRGWGDGGIKTVR